MRKPMKNKKLSRKQTKLEIFVFPIHFKYGQRWTFRLCFPLRWKLDNYTIEWMHEYKRKPSAVRAAKRIAAVINAKVRIIDEK